MRVPLTLLLLTTAPGADEGTPAKIPKRQEISFGEWNHLVKTIRDSGQTTAKRVARLRDAAARYFVIERAKILDIRPAPTYGKGALEIVPVGIEGGEVATTIGFIVRPSEAEVARKWSRWDRLAWRLMPRVASLDEIELQVVYNSLADLNRTPNPGVTMPSYKAAHTKFPRWWKLWRRYVRRKELRRSVAAPEALRGQGLHVSRPRRVDRARHDHSRLPEPEPGADRRRGPAAARARQGRAHDHAGAIRDHGRGRPPEVREPGRALGVHPQAVETER